MLAGAPCLPGAPPPRACRARQRSVRRHGTGPFACTHPSPVKREQEFAAERVRGLLVGEVVPGLESQVGWCSKTWLPSGPQGHVFCTETSSVVGAKGAGPRAVRTGRGQGGWPACRALTSAVALLCLGGEGAVQRGVLGLGGRGLKHS